MSFDIAIIVGSKSDLKNLTKGINMLKESNVPFEVKIFSAHRTPDLLKDYLSYAESNGCKLFIAGAGMSAHLPGVIASLTLKPVIGVPFDASSLNGVDSLLSICMMPPGIPVATMGIGSSGFFNACLFAMQILSINNENHLKLLKDQREAKKQEILKDNTDLEI